ncbi:MAG TPA: hypothetical protein VHQ65_15285, partial [Thermoanaerobaculia bacterium]|nr:hypothetical protein [Thermoanaerobaculia bacterium]
MSAPRPMPQPVPQPVPQPGVAGRRHRPSPRAWRRANGEWLEHAVDALRLALGIHCLSLRAEGAGEPLAAERHRVVADEELERLLAPRPARRAADDDPRAA